MSGRIRKRKGRKAGKDATSAESRIVPDPKEGLEHKSHFRVSLPYGDVVMGCCMVGGGTSSVKHWFPMASKQIPEPKGCPFKEVL